MDSGACILGICGAPCTGKTTLAAWLHRKLQRLNLDCELLVEPARLLAGRGVAIDMHMGPEDYAAFLAAYEQRDHGARAAISIADRTPVDHCSYLRANRNMPPELITQHNDVALAAMSRYRLVVYLPIQFPLRGDGFRVTSREYQQRLDEGIAEMLALLNVPVVTIRAERKKRRRLVFAEVESHWPELFGRSMTAGG